MPLSPAVEAGFENEVAAELVPDLIVLKVDY